MNRLSEVKYMKNVEIRQLIGETIATWITSGRHGDTSLTTKAFLVGDPCYWMPEEDRIEFNAQWAKTHPESYHGTYRDWTEFSWRGANVFVRSCSDGVNFGHCVDSGTVACIPASLFPNVVERFNALVGVYKGNF